MSKQDELKKLVAEYVEVGCYDASASLGIQQMPEGYGLILNADGSHYFWIRHDGVESCICWNKWWVYRGAKKDAQACINPAIDELIAKQGAKV